MSLFRPLILILICLLVLQPVSAAQAQQRFRVLVVFSYEEDFHWDVEIRQGIEAVLGEVAELHYAYLNTKRNLAGGPQRAAAAFQRYQSLQPDGVIAADDNAQSLFVLPYLKDRVATPVTFCGVNAEAADYGYPTAQISGILERFHIEETIAFNRQFTPEIKKFVFMVKESPNAERIARQLTKAAEQYSAELIAILRPTSLAQAIEMAREYRQQADLLLIDTLEGISDQTGRPVGDKQAMATVFQAFAKPTGSTNAAGVAAGALSAVIKSGDEQGRTAAQMLLQAMQGVALSELPVARNYRGRRLVNVTTMQQLGIVPKAIDLRGAQLLRQEE